MCFSCQNLPLIAANSPCQTFVLFPKVHLESAVDLFALPYGE